MSVDVVSVAGQAAKAAAACGRGDVERRLRIAVTRLSRPTTVVCVVGEFKQGKSSVVNGIVGRDICPADPDLSTSALTVLHHNDRPAVVVRRRVDSEAVVERVAESKLRAYVTEDGPADAAGDIERVEVGVAHPLLARGLVLVDTPCVGGLRAGQAAATVAFLPFADGVVLATDASAELSAAEVEFLVQATSACPTVLVCLTKIDLYPDWRRIAELDRAHLERAGVRASVLPVSALLRAIAVDRGDADLDQESGFPALVDNLVEGVLERARSDAGPRLRSEVRAALDELIGGAQCELALLSDPDRLAVARAEAEAARARLAQLQEGASRWAGVLGERSADLSREASHQFRASLRWCSRAADEALEAASTAAEWEEVTGALQRDVAQALTATFTALERGAESIGAEVARVLGEEAMPPGAWEFAPVDVAALWSGRSDRGESGARAALGHGMAMAGGASTGTIMLGMMSRLVPAVGASLLAATPVVLGAGVLFGAYRLSESKRREIALQRQQSRMAARQFVDDVQFAVDKQVADAVRDFQRAFRDQVAERVPALHEAFAAAVRRADEAVRSDGATREARAKVLTELLAALERLREQAA